MRLTNFDDRKFSEFYFYFFHVRSMQVLSSSVCLSVSDTRRQNVVYSEQSDLSLSYCFQYKNKTKTHKIKFKMVSNLLKLYLVQPHKRSVPRITSNQELQKNNNFILNNNKNTNNINLK